MIDEVITVVHVLVEVQDETLPVELVQEDPETINATT